MAGFKEYIKSHNYKVVNPFDRQRYGLCILKIDLHKGITSHINFYRDDMMEEDDAVFTYTNIPTECITEILQKK